MKIPFYQIDAFTNRAFSGCPAAVCPLDAWLPDDLLQKIANENNLSETAFFVPDSGDHDYHIRWFTPTVEMDLCGHATLASAALIFRDLRPELDTIRFSSLSGTLVVNRAGGGRFELDFPLRAGEPGEVPDELASALGARPDEVRVAGWSMAVFKDAGTIRTVTPDMGLLADRFPAGVMVTAPGDVDGIDYVVRVFAPGIGIPEDPATGSAQCTLVPYWADRLGKTELRALQVSARGGEFRLRLDGATNRALIGGGAVFVIEGTLTI
ncbi:MAG TPA: PhzF family phenazine biosynthesis protein [Thermomicrobiales bacterium]|nr:PhzF family phenazine biosynthesis protein [Thermomicrobiales bacterium]